MSKYTYYGKRVLLLSGGSRRKDIIALITSDFAVYEQVVSELKDRRAPFITLKLDDPIPPNVKVVITTRAEAGLLKLNGEKVVIYDEPRATVDRAICLLKGKLQAGPLVVGIDPGRRPGIAVLSGDIVIAVYQVTVSEVEPTMKKIAHDCQANIEIVRIGSGARLMTAQIVNALLNAGYRVEMVDETSTTPYVGSNIHTSTVRDIIAAINIARLKGEPVGRSKIEVEPSKGEIRVIQESSRSVSEGRATIPKYLARQVARGEITLDEAIALHKGGTQSQLTVK